MYRTELIIALQIQILVMLFKVWKELLMLEICDWSFLGHNSDMQIPKTRAIHYQR